MSDHRCATCGGTLSRAWEICPACHPGNPLGGPDITIHHGPENPAEAVAEIMRTPPEFLLKWTGGRVPVFKTDTNHMGTSWAYV